MEGYDLYQQEFPIHHHHHQRERRRGGGGGGGGSSKRGSGPKLSTDPQSVAARQRRHRISDRFRILKSLVPGGSKMDTVSMLEEAIQYVKFLKSQISLHQSAMMAASDDPPPPPPPPISFPFITTTTTDHDHDHDHTVAMACGSSYAADTQQMFGYSLAAPPSPLPPLPPCSFSFSGEEEEEMIPLVTFNY